MSLGRVLHETRCEPDGAGGTRFGQEVQLTAGPVVRPLRPVLEVFLCRRMERIGRELKDRVEARPARGRAGPAGAHRRR